MLKIHRTWHLTIFLFDKKELGSKHCTAYQSTRHKSKSNVVNILHMKQLLTHKRVSWPPISVT